MKTQHTSTCHSFKGITLSSLLIIIWWCSGFAQTLNRNMMTTDGAVLSNMQDGNSIYLGGTFNWVGWSAQHIARFTPGATKPDFTFPQLGGSSVYDMEPDGSGGYYSCGYTNTFNGTAVSSQVLHMLSNNTLDAAFNVSTDGVVYTISRQGNKLYIGGGFNQVNGELRSNVAAVDAGTGATLSWTADAPNSYVNKVQATASTVFIQGSFTYVGNQYLPANFAALDAATGHVILNMPEGDGAIHTFELDNDKLYVGGAFNNLGTPVQGLTKFTTTSTTSDAGFPRTDGYVFATLQDGSGGYFIGGTFSNVGGAAHNCIAHIFSDGTVDPNFNASANTSVWCLATDGTYLYMGGDFTVVNGTARNYVASVLKSNGNLTSWDPNANSSVYALAFSGSNIFMGGSFTTMKGASRNYAAAVSTSGAGTLQTWSPNTNSTVYAVIPDATGSNFYLGGYFTTVKGATHNYLAKVNSTNGTANSWNPSINSYVFAL